jgi:hypothetical protein
MGDNMTPAQVFVTITIALSVFIAWFFWLRQKAKNAMA